MGQCPAKSPFWVVFQVFKFFDQFSVNCKEPAHYACAYWKFYNASFFGNDPILTLSYFLIYVTARFKTFDPL